MTPKRPLTYRATGVLDNAELGLNALLKWVERTRAFRVGRGAQTRDVGFFANVVDIGHGMGLALCTDGVGSKVLVAQMVGRYNTVGIDCVAMNVNDAICVGAEPFAFLDYIAVERATPELLDQIGEGLHEGARRAGVAIVGGEISQIPDIIKGQRDGTGLDLVGMCVGFVALDKIIDGRGTVPGDVVIGVLSNGIHSNGLTLARRALFEDGGLRPDDPFGKPGWTIGDELLRPTHIYVKPVLELLGEDIPVRAFAHITGDGLLNLSRIDAEVGFELDGLPTPQPIFGLIQELGHVDQAEMYRVFNMGIGFCVIVPDDRGAIGATEKAFGAHGFETRVIGKAVADERKRVHLVEQGLVGEGNRFEPAER